MSGSPLIDLGGCAVNPEAVEGLSITKGLGIRVHLAGGSTCVTGGDLSIDEVEARLWRPEYVEPPGFGRVVAGPVVSRTPDPTRSGA